MLIKRDKLANVKLFRSKIQATRYEPMREVVSWFVVLPDSPCNGVSCATIEEAREVAKRHGFDGILL